MSNNNNTNTDVVTFDIDSMADVVSAAVAIGQSQWTFATTVRAHALPMLAVVDENGKRIHTNAAIGDSMADAIAANVKRSDVTLSDAAAKALDSQRLRKLVSLSSVVTDGEWSSMVESDTYGPFTVATHFLGFLNAGKTTRKVRNAALKRVTGGYAKHLPYAAAVDALKTMGTSAEDAAAADKRAAEALAERNARKAVVDAFIESLSTESTNAAGESVTVEPTAEVIAEQAERIRSGGTVARSDDDKVASVKRWSVEWQEAGDVDRLRELADFIIACADEAEAEQMAAAE